MPSPIDTLQELVRMSEEQRPAAVLWHGAVGAWYLGVAADWVLCIGSVLLSWTALTTEAGA